ncbi:MAG: nucleotidyl transferase AbiEii/AbiGii toxin family protein [Rhizobacter sp.]|nr:nucleotidyl transferase AbiEii/AbiGii toxin family protein [Rhizobacter sp.]
MFERAHHRRIAAVLEALDAPLLLAHRCLFGGGTAIALRYGEYRESVDVDFLVSDLAGYRALRERLTGPQGVQAVARAGVRLEAARELRADQYGLRTLLRVDGAEIKFEIVLEGRIELEPPGDDDVVCGVASLTRLDLATSKLLANSDRWADDSVFSRDLIDLAMMQPRGKLMKQAVAKAEGAYGASVRADLAKAVEHLLGREGRLERCMAAMQVNVPRALLWQRIKALR